MPSYPAEFKAQVLTALRAAPLNVQSIAKTYGIAHTTVTRWARAERIKLPSSRERISADFRAKVLAALRAGWRIPRELHAISHQKSCLTKPSQAPDTSPHRTLCHRRGRRYRLPSTSQLATAHDRTDNGSLSPALSDSVLAYEYRRSRKATPALSVRLILLGFK